MVRSLIGILTVGTLVVARNTDAQAPKRNERPPNQGSQSAPPGMCRVWLDGVRADSQPAPTDCASALRNRPPNARVIFGKQGDQRSLPARLAPEPSRPDSARKAKPDKKKPAKPDGRDR